MINSSNERKNYLKGLKTHKRKVTFFRLLLLFLIFFLWEISAKFNLIDPFLTSSPSRMLKALVQIYKEGTLFSHIGITCYETILGFSLGTILGALVAVLLWWSKFINEILEPYIVVLNALPKVALAPIIIFWVGNGISSIIIIALLISIVITTITVLNGFNSAHTDKIKLLKTFGASRTQILNYLIIPSSIPTIISALKINVGLSWVGVIMGEFLVAKKGLGFLIIWGQQIAQLDIVMMSIIILSILAYFMYILVALLEKKIQNKF